MKLKPMSDLIIVKQHEEETKTASGLILAMDAQKKFQGEVIRVGPGKITDIGTVRPMGINVGDVVLFGEYTGQKFKYDGVEYLTMHEADIIGVIER